MRILASPPEPLGIVAMLPDGGDGVDDPVAVILLGGISARLALLDVLYWSRPD
jgi:hypothetical protein